MNARNRNEGRTMKRILTSWFLALGFLLPSAQADQSSTVPATDGLVLWYRQPAKQWVEALPVGNGRLGAMVFGGTNNERIQLNEDTLWAGGPYDPTSAEALEALPEARRLIFGGHYAQ